MRGYVLVNECSDSSVTRERVIAMAGALARQQVEIAEWWQRVPLQVVHADTEAAAPTEDGWCFAKLVDELDDPSALAYHTTILGRPAILIGAQITRSNARPGTDWISGPDSLATATSHELCETTINPYCRDYAPLDGSTWIPKEVCDPVQGDAYELDPGSGLYLSDFVGPRYFSDGAGPYDRMGLVTAPGQLRPGGYQERLVGGPSGSSAPVFGDRMAPWKRAAKLAPGSRRSRLAQYRWQP